MPWMLELAVVEEHEGNFDEARDAAQTRKTRV